jgi:4-amino-4-deoxy-L-arabinose transferase-like glycosyltransferase
VAATSDRGRRRRNRNAGANARAAAAAKTPWYEGRPARIAIALAVLHLFLALVAFNPTPFMGGDNAAYFALAKSLVERHAYLSLWEPAAPPHTQYPPVYPASVALLWLLGLHGWIVMKSVVLACSVAAVGLAYLWLRRTTTAGVAIVSGVLLAISPGVLELSHWELSDVPAWALTMLALWASTHLAGSPERERLADEQRHGLWLGVMVAGAVLGNFTRSAGLPLVVAALVWLTLRRRWKDLAVLAGVFFPLFFLWWLWGKVNGGPGYSGYLWAVDPYQPAKGTVGLGGLLTRIWMNTTRYSGMHLPVLVSWNGLNRYWLGVPILVLAIAGWARRLRKPGLAEVWVPPYVGLLLLWPATWSGERFLLPLLPLLFCYAGEVLRDAAQRLHRPMAARLAPLAAVAVMLIAAFPGLPGVLAVGRACSHMYRAGDPFPCMPPEYHDFFALAASTRGKLLPGSAVLSRKATIFYAVSGYPGQTYPLSANPDTFFAFARKIGAGYVAYDQIRDLAPLYLHPVLKARHDEFCVVPGLVFPASALLKIEHGAPRPGVAENSFRQCGYR